MSDYKIVLAGQPNVGKSSLINSISNSKLKVGNFSGVTVEKTQIFFKHHSHQFEIVDLPGIYSIFGHSKDEMIARDFLINEEYDFIINVIDATNLKRNLLLSTELINLNKKMILVLNMYDEAKLEMIDIDIKQIEAITGIPTLAVSSKTKEGIDNLLEIIHACCDDLNRKKYTINFSDIVEEKLYLLTNKITNIKLIHEDLSSREIAIKLLFDDEKFYSFIHDKPIFIQIQPILSESKQKIATYYNNENIKEILSNEYYAIAKGIETKTVTYSKPNRDIPLTKHIDNILINKFLGIPIFLFFMWSLFQLTFEIGSIPMDYIEQGTVWLSNSIKQSISHQGLGSLIADGIIAGVGAVLLFLPNIIILYIGIGLLETTGYMSRVAFLLDGFFNKFGLHGKSFIPLVTGFGCSVPAYMSTRILKNEKDRLITLFIIGFMSCGAKLPVYILLVGAFFSQHDSGNVLFILYISGAILGLILAKILRIFIFTGEDEPFVMEMPKYRLPTIKLIYHIVYSKASSYIKKAGTFILAASILIWFASAYPKTDPNNPSIQLENSYLGQIGKFTNPLFEPLGFDWKLTIALETGLAAKEIVVATLAILYLNEESDDVANEKLLSQLKSEIPLPTAIAFITFVMLYMPCLAASLVFKKEAGGLKYLAYLFIFTSIVSWLGAYMAYYFASILM